MEAIQLMSVNPISGNTPVTIPEAAVKPEPPKNESGIPQDTVTLTTPAKGQATPSSGDVNHDGDSK
jgi:hypothetical protein